MNKVGAQVDSLLQELHDDLRKAKHRIHDQEMWQNAILVRLKALEEQPKPGQLIETTGKSDEEVRKLVSDFAEVYNSSGPPEHPEPEEEWKAVLEEARNGPLSTVAYVEKDQAVLEALAKLVVQERKAHGFNIRTRDDVFSKSMKAVSNERDRCMEAFDELVGSIRGTNSGVAVHSVRFSEEYICYLEKKARGE